MGIITLLSDMGLRDHYVAAVKAALYQHAPQATLVDISHLVAPFDVDGAAYLLKSVWRNFPIGTVHLVGISPELRPDQSQVAIHFMGHYFVGADNGVFSLLFDQHPEEIFEISLPQGDDWNFPMKGVLAVAAAHLSKGGAPEFLGRQVHSLRSVQSVRPIVTEDVIQAHVAFIDHYGNVYTNLTRTLFEAARRGRPFVIIPKRVSEALDQVSDLFADVADGELLAIWASNDHLMLAVKGGVEGHGGSARSLFGFRLNDIVRIEFHGEAHR